MGKICEGFLEIWSIVCQVWHFENGFGGHIGSRDLEIGQGSSPFSA